MTSGMENGSHSESPFIAPRELMARWRCGRSSVDRIARRAGLTRFCLGTGKNGTVRYPSFQTSGRLPSAKWPSRLPRLGRRTADGRRTCGAASAGAEGRFPA